MNAVSSKKMSDSVSDNRKSEIQNLKWLGLFVIAFVLVVCGAVADAQQTKKSFRIGFLDASTASGIAGLLEAFRQEMGKSDGSRERISPSSTDSPRQKFERLPELAADLVRLNVDLIVAAGTPSALAAKKATTTIPIVMPNTGDPVAAGLVASLARPGGNITGLVKFRARAKHQTAGDTQGRRPQARPSWTSVAVRGRLEQISNSKSSGPRLWH